MRRSRDQHYADESRGMTDDPFGVDGIGRASGTMIYRADASTRSRILPRRATGLAFDAVKCGIVGGRHSARRRDHSGEEMASVAADAGERIP